MNSGLKYGLIFLGGVALGALGASVLGKGKIDLKPLATDLMSRGMSVKDLVLGKVEQIKEDLEDVAAAARQKADKDEGEKATS